MSDEIKGDAEKVNTPYGERIHRKGSCQNCPHGVTLHNQLGKCEVALCGCKGFEWDTPQEVERVHQGQVVTRPYAVSEAGMNPDEALVGLTPRSVIPGNTEVKVTFEKSEVLRTSHQGKHYHDFQIEPIQYIEANQIPFHEANIIKYVSRWKLKDGVDDLKKARFYLDRLIELEETQ